MMTWQELINEKIKEQEDIIAFEMRLLEIGCPIIPSTNYKDIYGDELAQKI